MTKEEFIALIATNGEQGDTTHLKEYISKNTAMFFSKDYFVDEFLQLIMSIDESNPEQPLIQVIYTVTQDFLGPIDLIPYIDNKDYSKMILGWLRAMTSLEYSVINKNNNDYDILDEMFGDKE